MINKQQDIEAIFNTAFVNISKGNIAQAKTILKEQKLSKQYKTIQNIVLDLLYKEEMSCDPNTGNLATYLEWYTDIEIRLIIVIVLTKLSEAVSKGNIEDEIKKPILKYTQCTLWIFGMEIIKAAGNYPDESISGQIWINGKIARDLALRMALVFEKEQNNFYELDMYNIRAKITTSIMAHYHHLVGPAMIDAANCFLKINKPTKAIDHFNAVFLDFKWLVEEYKIGEEIIDEDKIAMQSLKDACEGLFQLNEGSKKIKNILLKVKDLL